MTQETTKRILVTGASGFIGLHCLPFLTARGFEVHALDNRDCPQIPARCHCVDLMNPAEVTEVLGRIKPTHMLHLAWCTEPGLFWNDKNNLPWVAASLNLYRAFVQGGGRRFVAAGTCAEYDWGHDLLDERATPLEPATFYGVCKAALYSVLASAAALDEVSLAWGRVFFLYGPGEKPGRLVSDAIRELLRGRPLATTPGLQERDFMHVADVAGAFAALCDSEVEGPVNIASGETRPLKDLLFTIGEIIGRHDLLQFGARPMPANEPMRLAAATNRLNQEVGFQPRYDLEGGIRDAIQWWQRHGFEEK